MEKPRELPTDGGQEDPLEKDRQRGLKNIRDLGPHKPMGYLPIGSLSYYFHSSVEQEIARAHQSGFKYLELPSTAANRAAFYVYDEPSLEELLKKDHEILENNQWPIDPEGFVRKVASENIPVGTPLFKLIARAFGDTFSESLDEDAYD